MAISYTRNLKLRIDSNSTANSKYNLEKLDTLAGTFIPDNTDTITIRSRGDIKLEPNSADLNGSGTGGTVSVGSAGNPISNLNIFSESVQFSKSIGLLDQSTSGTRYLRVRYKSDASGSQDTASDRTLTIDLDTGDRSLILGGNLTVSGGNITLITPSGSTVTLPLTGTLATLAGNETLTNKTIDATSSINTITNIRNVSIASDAAISGSKIANTPSGNLAAVDLQSALNELQTDIDTRATTSALNTHTGLSIAHGVSSNLVGISDTQTLTNKTIDASSNTVSNISLTTSVAGILPITNGGTGSSTANGSLNALLPTQSGNNGKVLSTDGANTSWVTSAATLSYSDTWSGSTSKTVTHNLGTSKVSIIVVDDTGDIVYTDISITDNNTIQLTSSEVPAGPWNITVIGAA